MRDDYLKLFSKNWDYFTILLDKSQDVFWITSTDYSVQIYVSPAFEKIWGYESSVLYENPLFWLETIVEEDRHRLAAISRLPHSSVLSSYKEKYRITTARGEQRWILDHTYPILNKIGQCIGYAGIAQDITNTQKLEEDLQIANKFLPKLAEKMENTIFWVKDPSFKKQLYLSAAFEKIWGRPREYIYKDPGGWHETVVSDDKQRDPNSMLAIFNQLGDQTHYSDTYRIKRPSGDERWIKDLSFPIFDENSRECIGFAGIAQDITQEKLYEIELQQAKERAEAANIAKSNFIASMSHDFRTPLNGLLGMAEMLKSSRCYPEQKEAIQAIQQASNTLLDLVEDIINFVALDLNKLPVQAEWFDLHKLVSEIVLAVSPQAQQKKIEVICNYSDQVPSEVHGDLNRIRRILMNIISNAVKFTTDGHVLINVELQKTIKNMMWLEFMIEDTGIGISKENFEYIFGSFNRIEPSYRGRYKGTGLGLTIVRQFVSDLGGTIQLKSEIERGSIFYVSIPFEVLEKPVEKSLVRVSKVKSLIVDDYVRRAETLVKQFDFNNAGIVVGARAVHEICKAAKKCEPFELILLAEDIQEDVFELAQELRASYDGILILLSDGNNELSLDLLREVGFDDVIIQPLEPLTVRQTLEDALALLPIPFAKRYSLGQGESRSVLLVEDDILTQKITSWMLQELNWKVQVACTGKQALNLLEKKFDLVIMDVGLPDIDGISLASRIRQAHTQNQNIPIVALTAHVMEKDKEKCLAAGMNDFLKKPLFKKDLKNVLTKIFLDL